MASYSASAEKASLGVSSVRNLYPLNASLLNEVRTAEIRTRQTNYRNCRSSLLIIDGRSLPGPSVTFKS